MRYSGSALTDLCFTSEQCLIGALSSHDFVVLASYENYCKKNENKEKKTENCIVENRVKMAAALCRLCYEVKPATVDIFSEKGFLLGIASAIRMHLMDEVRTHMPPHAHTKMHVVPTGSASFCSCC